MQFDVIVIGGGHAGCEAANAAARLGASVAMVVLREDRIGFMSCNPAIGGLAKGQIVKEIDALGGVMARITDRAAIQYRRLNSSKGPAVRSSRAQCDKEQYAREMQSYVAQRGDIRVVSAEATSVIVEEGRVQGVTLQDGSRLKASSVVMTTGTFLRAVMHTGDDQSSGGRVGDRAAHSLGQWLEDSGLRLSRLKTGTPPRLHRRSIDFSQTEPQPGDVDPRPFSFYSVPTPFPYLPQISCFISYTNEKTHEVIENNFFRSPMFTGVIQGKGPRYCPSIEDKVKRFREKDRHQIFLEPEGLNTEEIYVNGISTSLPRDVQEAFVRSISGLESAEFLKYGYAVEYDAVDARQLRATLECKDIPGLFFAGQVNGTSGYEEAAGQGLVAGVNAALQAKGRDPWVLGREDAYIGVMIDDLILMGADEPYRMFTSRAEHRLSLREDNADLRLSRMGFALGLLPEADLRTFEVKEKAIQAALEQNRSKSWNPGSNADLWLQERGLPPLKDRVSAESLLKRPEIALSDLYGLGIEPISDPWVAEQVEIHTKYEGYIRREREALEQVKKNDSLKIPERLQFSDIGGLSTEILSRLELTRPETLGQMSRMPGMTPAAVACVLIHLKRVV